MVRRYLPLALILVTMAYAASVTEFREVCVEAKALGLTGRSVTHVAFLAWDGARFTALPYRVEAKEITVLPLVFNITDVWQYAFTSHTLPGSFDDGTVVCISLPKRAPRPPPKGPRGGIYTKSATRTSWSRVDFPTTPRLPRW